MVFRNWKARYSKITSAEAAERLQRKLTEQVQGFKNQPNSPAKTSPSTSTPSSASQSPQREQDEDFQNRFHPISASHYSNEMPHDTLDELQRNRSPSAANYAVTMHNAPPETTLGRHIARRLVEIGVKDVFHVPGDFNLLLLDELLLEPQLNLIGCCNELNAGYAADGYARSKGVGCVVVTFTVGGLSVINAIAGSYSENLPVICIVGGPNSNDYGTSRILHHTIGLPDFSQELRCFRTVTCSQVTVNDLNSAHEMVDSAFATALRESKPVYISVSCNLPHISHPSFVPDLPFGPQTRISNPATLQAAVNSAAEFLNRSVKPVLVCGPRIRLAKAKKACIQFANAAGYPVAVMPSAKVQPDRVTVGSGASYGCVIMVEFLNLLAEKVRKNEVAYENYKRIYIPPGVVEKSQPNDPLRINVLFQYIQNMLSSNTAVIAETGDSWFNCQKLKLPEGCGYEFQMQYGSIGWSVGATLGYAQAAANKRVIACIGDGSFQVTCQDISTMIRQNHRSVIFLINNGGYTIEVEIHDGPYNVIKNWDYCGLIEAIRNGDGRVWTRKVSTEDELVRAIGEIESEENWNNLCFVEIVCHKDDTSKELLEWGSRVSAANSRMSQVLTE